jgi:hypothetical protein
MAQTLPGENMDNRDNKSMINVTGLWLNKDKNQNSYMAGNCGNVRYWVFKNRNKKDDKDPDYILKISQNIKPIRKNNEDDDKEGEIDF